VEDAPRDVAPRCEVLIQLCETSGVGDIEAERHVLCREGGAFGGCPDTVATTRPVAGAIVCVRCWLDKLGAIARSAAAPVAPTEEETF
jgi:hypothetical protein